MLVVGTLMPLLSLQDLEVKCTHRHQDKTDGEDHPDQPDTKTDTFPQFFHQSTVITCSEEGRRKFSSFRATRSIRSGLLRLAASSERLVASCRKLRSVLSNCDRNNFV